MERCSGTGCTNFAQIGTTTGTGTTYKDTTVSAPNSYSAGSTTGSTTSPPSASMRCG